jgi:hypothetical protein
MEKIIMKQPTGLKAVGMVQHPETKYWQVWVSTTGQRIICVAAFQKSEMANDVVKLIQQEAQQGGLTQPEVVTALFGFLNQRSEMRPQNLPASLEVELLNEVGNII